MSEHVKFALFLEKKERRLINYLVKKFVLKNGNVKLRIKLLMLSNSIKLLKYQIKVILKILKMITYIFKCINL